ncbi:MAG TPA: YnbE family lipoprotein [Sphingomonadaceae bacterium]
MKTLKLTNLDAPAHNARMELKRTGAAGLVLVAGLATLSGCISVNAPDKPIVIELNINISQEVVYKLAPDVKANIEDNPGIF